MQELLDDQSSTEKSRLSTEGARIAKNTNPWLRFMGVMFVIFGILGVVYGVAFYSGAKNSLYMPFAVLYIVLSVVLVASTASILMGSFLIQQSNALKKYLAIGNGSDLDQAYKRNFHFWLTLSVVTIVYTILIIALLFIAFAGVRGLD